MAQELVSSRLRSLLHKLRKRSFSQVVFEVDDIVHDIHGEHQCFRICVKIGTRERKDKVVLIRKEFFRHAGPFFLKSAVFFKMYVA